jgi:hypothetical protein
MLEKRDLRNKILLRLLTSPWTLAPFVLGSTLLAGALAFSAKPGMMVLAGLAGVLGGIGTFFTRFMLGAEKITRNSIAELQRESLDERERRMDELDRRLVSDEDPRTESALRDLRALEKAYSDLGGWGAKLDSASRFDIVSGVQDLYDNSADSLETAQQLWETASRLRTEEARQPILERREEIIADVRESIDQLSRLMVGIQQLGEARESGSELARIRSQLDENLTVAKSVQEKMRSWQRDHLGVE